MGRELQKKKRRSGRQPVRRPQSAQAQKKVLHNRIIRENWNKKETLSQNYRRLGLVSKLNRRAGGVQKLGVDSDKAEVEPNPFAIAPGTTRAAAVKPLNEIAIERDAETGELLLDDTVGANPLQDPLNELEEQEQKDWVSVMGFIGAETRVRQTDVTQALESLAKNGVKKKPRHQSEREEEWLQKLVARYGDDYEAMFRDRKLNVMQQSQGDLKKRVRKWKASQARSLGD